MENGQGNTPEQGPENGRPAEPTGAPQPARLAARQPASAWASSARQAMLGHTILWMPPIATNFLQMLTLTRPGSEVAQGVIALTAGMAGLIIEAGWLEMIGRSLKGQAPTIKDFAHGINARWGQILLGNFAFVLLAILLFLGAYMWGEHQWGSKELVQWYQSVAKLPAPEQIAALQPEKLPAFVRDWLNLFMAWLLALGALGLGLIAWQPFCVIGRLSWWRAWGASLRLVFRRFPAVFAFGVTQVLMWFFALTLGTSGQMLGSLIGAVMLLMVTIFFKILYSAAVVDALGGPDAVLSDTAP